MGSNKAYSICSARIVAPELFSTAQCLPQSRPVTSSTNLWSSKLDQGVSDHGRLNSAALPEHERSLLEDRVSFACLARDNFERSQAPAVEPSKQPIGRNLTLFS